MCGICGVINFDDSRVSEKEINLMNHEMVLRGPDDFGTYVNNNLGMGMRRLSIIDVNKGHQPMFSNDGKIIIVFNGEIYNYLELKSDLIKKGYTFSTTSDTEVLIKMYEEYGERFIEKINGMFSICIFDKNINLFLIIRDRLGIKPLFYYYNKKKLYFSSSLKSIKKVLSNININKKNFLLYLTANYVPNSESIYSDINKLKPGKYIRIQNNRIQIIKYWNLPNSNKFSKDDEFEQHLKNLILNSIKIQSRSDVEVGSMLSGGVDSSIVTSLFAKNIDKKIKTFCLDFIGKNQNENNDAQIVSKNINSDHFSKNVDYKIFYESLEKISNLLDEPISDNAIISSYFVSEMAKKNNVKVVLSGAGGDELFGGYSRHYQSFKNFFIGAICVESNSANKLVKMLPINMRNYFFKIKSKSLKYINDTSGVNISSLFSIIKDGKILDETIFQIEQIYKPFLEQKTVNYKKKVMSTDLLNYLPDNVLSLLDKTTMMNSIEGRVPFLDHRIVEHIYSSNNCIFKNNKFNNSKIILKKIFKNDIPNHIYEKPKIGFNAPLNNWKNENFNYFKKNFSENSFYYDFFNKNFTKEDFLSRKEYTGLLFSLIVFDKWLISNNE